MCTEESTGRRPLFKAEVEEIKRWVFGESGLSRAAAEEVVVFLLTAPHIKIKRSRETPPTWQRYELQLILNLTVPPGKPEPPPTL